MGAKLQVLLSVLVSYALFQVYSVTASSNNGGKHLRKGESPVRPQWFVDLGYIDGRYFYADVNLTMDWYEAKEHCEMHFMQLSAITTEIQWNTIIDALEPYGPLRLWTSARESRKSSMFVFDSTGREPNASVITDWQHNRENEPYHYCGYFFANGRNNSRFWTERCDYPVGINLLCFQ